MAKQVRVQEPEITRKRSLKGIVARNISGWILVLPSILLFFLLVWRPLAIGMTYSFFDLKGFVPVEFVGFKNFQQVLSDTNFIQTLWNTLKYVLWSLIIGFPLPFIIAVMLNEMVRLQGYFKFTTYLPVIVPTIASCMIWKLVYADGPSGLLNMLLYYFGGQPIGWLSNGNLAIPLIIIMMTWCGFGGTTIMYLATMQGINNELYEAARLDGAGFFGRIRHVLFPHMRGIMLLCAIRQFIGVFSITEQPLTMTGGGPNGATLTLGLTNYYYAFKYGQYDKSLALGVVTFFLLLFLTFVYFGLEKKVDQ